MWIKMEQTRWFKEPRHENNTRTVHWMLRENYQSNVLLSMLGTLHDEGRVLYDFQVNDSELARLANLNPGDVTDVLMDSDEVGGFLTRLEMGAERPHYLNSEKSDYSIPKVSELPERLKRAEEARRPGLFFGHTFSFN